MGFIKIVEQAPQVEYVGNGLPPNGSRPPVDHDESEPGPPLSEAESSVLIDAVSRASRVGLVMRTGLFLVALAAAALAVVYTMQHGDAMVDAILNRDRATDLLWERVVSLTLPVALFVLLGAVCIAGAYVLQSRALDERERALDAIARVRRESEAGVSRARTLARLTEDDLTHARREFAMQVGFGRASWWLTIALVGVSVVYSVAEGLDEYSAIFAAGGVGSYLLSIAFNVPTTVRCNLSALSQRHVIVSGYAREIGLLETEAYRLISHARRQSQPCAATSADVTAAAREIREATDEAVQRIEKHCKSRPDRDDRR